MLLDCAFQAYEDDVRTLVDRGVRASQALLDGDQDLSPASRLFHRDRLEALSRWSALKNPLGYQESAHTHLVRAIVDQPQLLANGLPAAACSPKSVPWFVANIIKAAEAQTAVTLPPFISNGIALPLMRETIREVRTTLSGDSTRDVASILEHLLVRAVNQREIMNVPWSRNAPPGPGRPPYSVVYDIWLNLGAQYKMSSPSLTLVGSSSQHDANAARSSIQAMSTDSRASWSFQELVLQDLHQILNRSSLPTEWKMGSMSFNNDSDSAYVKNTYLWVRNNYNAQKPIHQTAVLLAIIFTAILPDVLHGVAVPSLLTNNSSAAEITAAVRNSEWKSPPKGRKGFVDRTPFMMMISTFIIAIYEPTSPLRQYMSEHGGNLGSAWTSKHGISFPFVFCLGIQHWHFSRCKGRQTLQSRPYWHCNC